MVAPPTYAYIVTGLDRDRDDHARHRGHDNIGRVDHHLGGHVLVQLIFVRRQNLDGKLIRGTAQMVSMGDSYGAHYDTYQRALEAQVERVCLVVQMLNNDVLVVHLSVQ